MEPKPRLQPLKVREERSKQFPRKTIAELKASLEQGIPACDLVDPTTEELDDPLPLPDVLKNIIGKTYQIALCVEQDNISRGNDEYKVSEVLTSQNLNHAALEPEVDYPVDLSSMSSSDQSTDVKVHGVLAVDNSKEHDQPKFIHKLDEAGQEAITKVSEAEQKQVLLKNIKLEKLEGQKGAK
ncbi:predicted protein [Arabidopsis lyrata subsp. lyrata]|uniref:Predicted protein n=1 Tax=Arabidopsis lyrata subsp. lyrata TaxID=81972 RepID=D7LMI8_ARALL|nr:predicted protein [Arabidopsis lyrata subsp. lyrata]